jgi:hypothetical protein
MNPSLLIIKMARELSLQRHADGPFHDKNKALMLHNGS